MSKQYKKSKKNSKTPVIIGIGLATIILFVVIMIISRPKSAAETASLPLEVSVAQASELRDAGAFILDVREQSEWNEIHVPEATLIPLGELERRINEVPKDKQIVVICRSGNRSQQGRDILLNAGYENVTSISGGIQKWKAAGLPTVSGQ